MGDRMDMSLDDLIGSKPGGRGGKGRGGKGTRSGKGGGRREERGGDRSDRSNNFNSSSNFLYDDRESSGGGGGGGRLSSDLEWGPTRRSGGGGPVRRSGAARSARDASAPYQRRQMRSEGNDGGGGGGSVLDRLGPREVSGTRLLVSNLHHDVMEKDLKELFETKGLVKKVKMKYDRTGRGSGDAEVVFAQRSVAIDVIKSFNGMTLDGKALVLKLIDEPTPEFDEDGADTGESSFNDNKSYASEREKNRARKAANSNNVREGLFGTAMNDSSGSNGDFNEGDDRGNGNRRQNRRDGDFEPTFIVSLNGNGKKEFTSTRSRGAAKGGKGGRGGRDGGRKGGGGKGRGNGGGRRDEPDVDLDSMMESYHSKSAE